MNSFKDSEGRLWVACSECERGRNGKFSEKCASAKSKKFTGIGCFCGILLNKLLKKMNKENL